LQEEKAALAEELSAAKSDAECKVEAINKLETAVKNLETAKTDALDLATDLANRVNQLEQSLKVTSQDLESARQEISIANPSFNEYNRLDHAQLWNSSAIKKSPCCRTVC
jgi:predicted nuclease with TOPRIM domain